MSLVSCSWDLEVGNLKPLPTEISTIGCPWSVWPVCGDDNERLENQRVLRNLLHRDHVGQLCKPCLEFRRNKPDHQLLDCAKRFAESTSSWCYWCRFSHPWPCSDNRSEATQKCVQCQVDHPKVFFAIGKGKNPRKGIRSCIGWTAKINICPHISWAWKEAQKQLKRVTGNQMGMGMNILRVMGKCPCAEPPSVPSGKGQEQVVEARFSDGLTTLSVYSRTLALKLNTGTPIRHDNLRAWTSSPSNQQALKGIL